MNYGIAIKEIGCVLINVSDYASLHSRRLEVVGARKNVHARGEGACLPLVRAFFLAPTTSRAGYDYARDSLETKKLCCYHKFGQSMKIADILQPHHWFWKHSPQNDILGMSAEISYWWKTRARHAQAKRGSFVSPRPNAQADRCKACALELKPRAEKKMADVLDVDVEDKGGFSEDEGDGKS